jgi:hypothetical protein
MKGVEPNIPGIQELQRESRIEDVQLAVWRLREIESVSDNDGKSSTLAGKSEYLGAR